MPNRRLHLAFSLSFVTAAALAQGPARAQAAQPPSATPATPAAASPAELHRSALRREPNAAPEPVGSWPEANRVVDDGQALQAAIALAQQLADLPQTCLRNDRRSSYEQFGMTLDQALAHEFRLGLQTLASGEASSGAVAFAQGAGRGGKRL